MWMAAGIWFESRRGEPKFTPVRGCSPTCVYAHLGIRPTIQNVLGVTQFRRKTGVFGRASPAQTPPSSHQLRKSYVY